MAHLHVRATLVLAGPLDEPKEMNLARRGPIQFRYLLFGQFKLKRN